MFLWFLVSVASWLLIGPVAVLCGFVAFLPQQRTSRRNDAPEGESPPDSVRQLR